MKFISFEKYKAYLESFGYVKENNENIYSNFGFKTIFFSKPNEKLKYSVNVYLNSDNIVAINHGYGSPYLGWTSVKIDMRKKFWKNFICEN